MLVDVGVGAGEEEDVVGELGLGGPDLLARDDPLVAVGHGPGRERRQVAPGIGLGESLAPRDGAVQDLGDEFPLLLLRAPLQDGGTDQGVAEEVGAHRGVAAGELLVQDDLLDERQALAAVLLGPGGADPAPLVELADPVDVERLALVPGHGVPGLAPPRGQVLVEPAADLQAEGLCLGRIGQVHGPKVPPSAGPGQGRPGEPVQPIWTAFTSSRTTDTTR